MLDRMSGTILGCWGVPLGEAGAVRSDVMIFEDPNATVYRGTLQFVAG